MSKRPPSVLIVDESSDNREVLRTVLARRGLRIFEADAAASGLQLARQHHPDVIVLDLDESLSADDVGQRFAVEASGCHSRIIMLGKVRCGLVSNGGHVVAKPYHFGPLVHTIEQLAAKAA